MDIQFKVRAGGRAEILLYGDIGWDVTAAEFAESLRGLGSPSAIALRINSYGGDVFDGVAIHSLLTSHPARVTAHVDGVAASAASVVAMAGAEIEMAEAAMMMIHDPWVMTAGSADDLRGTADRLDAVGAQMARIYSARSGVSGSDVRAWMRVEKWFSADEAVTAGFADRMVEREPIAAHYDPDRHKYRLPPPNYASKGMAEARRLCDTMALVALGAGAKLNGAGHGQTSRVARPDRKNGRGKPDHDGHGGRRGPRA